MIQPAPLKKKLLKKRNIDAIPVKKTITHFRVLVLSRHPTHDILRRELPLMNFRSVVRLGSETIKEDAVSEGGKRIECNTVEAIENTANKIRMKEIFRDAKIKSPEFIIPTSDSEILAWAKKVQYPIVVKIQNHSRGRGMEKIDDEKQLKAWLASNNEHRHIFEKYYNFAREYRLHTSQFGCFYPFRKMRKADAKDRWFFNSTNSVFMIESNPLFERPKCWDKIVEECKKALVALKLDIGGFDVRVNKDGSDFAIIEANSACSFGDLTARRYIHEITKVLQDKHLQFKQQH